MPIEGSDNTVDLDDVNAESESDDCTAAEAEKSSPPKEIGGRKGPDPTRYGDWEKNGRCIDF